MKRTMVCVSSLTLLALVLAACSRQPAASTPAPTAPPAAGSDLTRSDDQGSVTFAITPLNLSAPGETIDFDVSMNTHSVDLGWDLAAQSVLRTDKGLEVQGLEWPGGSGHHVSGVLSYPAKTADGQPLLEGASTVTLIIREAGVPERSFAWSLTR